MKKCPACNSESHDVFKKKTTQYYQCSYCRTTFSDALPNDNMVGGGFEVERNTQQNAGRLERFFGIVGRFGKMLDYGCGHGMLVDYLKENKVKAFGYDKYNPDYNFIKESEFDLVSMVEVIEHLSHPFRELDQINLLLKDGGILYIETSFVDVAERLKTPLDEFFYIEPSVGHSTIFSHFGLDILMVKKGFLPLTHINENVRLYKKVSNESV
jgi:cyclopropane fatty-acyl-phospholipid synthase-like methyltransferase